MPDGSPDTFGAHEPSEFGEVTGSQFRFSEAGGQSVNEQAAALCANGSRPEKGNARFEWPNRASNKSGRRDLNPGPPAPEAGALPGCATPRGGMGPEGLEPPTF